MRILYITTVGATMNFFNKLFCEMVSDGIEVELASNETDQDYKEETKKIGLKMHHIDCSRRLIDLGNIKCIWQIRELVKKEKYDIVHCHTPIAAFCTRIACAGLRRNGLKVFYTAHGFHFYKGAPIKNWIMYYSAEWIAAFFTDVLITMNLEDYDIAKKHMHAKEIVYVPGVGIDTRKFDLVIIDKKEKRRTLGVNDDDVLLLSVGALEESKNQIEMIDALGLLFKKNIELAKRVVLAIAGTGDLGDMLIQRAKELNIDNRVKLLGFRKDVPELLKAADLFVFPSIVEGLPVSLMEAMASGLPVICSNARGNTDLVLDERYVFDYHDSNTLYSSLKFALTTENGEEIKNNRNHIQKFDYQYVNPVMISLYKESM